MTYYYLKPGDIVKEGDEFTDDANYVFGDDGKIASFILKDNPVWNSVYSFNIGIPYDKNWLPVRRKIKKKIIG